MFVTGRTSRPGSYTVSSLSTLVNVLLACGGPDRNGSMRNVQVKRGGKVVAHFDLYDFLLKGDKTHDVRLQPQDVIFIPQAGPQVALIGNVRTPAIYELKGKGRLSDLLFLAGGLSSTGFKGRVQVYRVQNNQYRSFLEGDLEELQIPSKDFSLSDGDVVRVYPVSDRENLVTLAGPVVRPGTYGVQDGVTRLRDVLLRAGGILPFASDEAELTRVHITQSGPETERISVNLKAALGGGSFPEPAPSGE